MVGWFNLPFPPCLFDLNSLAMTGSYITTQTADFCVTERKSVGSERKKASVERGRVKEEGEVGGD